MSNNDIRAAVDGILEMRMTGSSFDIDGNDFDISFDDECYADEDYDGGIDEIDFN